MLSFDFFDAEQVGQLGAEVSGMADLVTGDDRSAYEVWFHDNEIWIGFEQEDDRDEFAEICDDEAAADEDVFDDPAPLMDARMQAITAH